MDEYSVLIELLTEVLGEPSRHTHSKHQISFDCPVCSYEIKGLDSGDKKGNLEVNYEKGVFKCWSCAETHDTHGGLFKLFKKWGTKQHLKKLELVLPDDVLPTQRTYKKIYLPKEFISFTDVPESLKLTHHYKQAVNYLHQRSISEEHITKFNIGFCYEGFYAGRIIIPSYDKNGQLNYFIARSYGRHRLKYRNPEAEKEKIIFNEHLIDWSRDIYLVEGAFDSLFVPNSIPLLGKFISDTLWRRLYEEAQGNIFILLDGDAWRNSEILYQKLSGGKLHKRVRVIKLPIDKDIADLKGQIKEEWVMELEL